MLHPTLVSIWLQFVSAQLIPRKAAQHLADSYRAFMLRKYNFCKSPRYGPKIIVWSGHTEQTMGGNDTTQSKRSIDSLFALRLAKKTSTFLQNQIRTTAMVQIYDFPTPVFHTGSIVKKNHPLIQTIWICNMQKRCQNAFFPNLSSHLIRHVPGRLIPPLIMHIQKWLYRHFFSYNATPITAQLSRIC